MQDFTIGDLGVFIGTVGGVVTSILIILQKSRCKSILWGCITRELDESKNTPVLPVEPILPVKPVKPTKPVKPVKPVEPVDPEDPEDPKTPNILMGEEEEEEILPDENLKK